MWKKALTVLALLVVGFVCAQTATTTTTTTTPATNLATPDKDVLLFAVSAAGSKPFSRQNVDRMTDVIVHNSNNKIAKANIHFLQTAVVKDADGKNDLTIGLFRVDQDLAGSQALLNDATLVSTLDRTLGGVLKGYTDVRTTFARETIPGTCFNGVKDADEKGTDCGNECFACPDGSVCTDHPDCASGRCVNGRCASLRNGAAVVTVLGAVLSVAAAGIALF